MSGRPVISVSAGKVPRDLAMSTASGLVHARAALYRMQNSSSIVAAAGTGGAGGTVGSSVAGVASACSGVGTIGVQCSVLGKGLMDSGCSGASVLSDSSVGKRRCSVQFCMCFNSVSMCFVGAFWPKSVSRQMDASLAAPRGVGIIFSRFVVSMACMASARESSWLAVAVLA